MDEKLPAKQQLHLTLRAKMKRRKTTGTGTPMNKRKWLNWISESLFEKLRIQ